MSADNGIYILKSLDGYRVIETQAIENIYWHFLCCNNPDIIWFESEDGCSHEKCKSCDTIDPKGQSKNEINPYFLKEYFGESTVYKTEQEALKKSEELYNNILNDDFCPILEYGISYIKGWETKNFPN